MSSDFYYNSLSSVSEEWQKLLTHFDWGVGFSFVVILVPNPQDAEIRRQALERTLAAENKTITRISFSSPDELKQLAGTLLDLQTAPDTGAIWVSAVVSEANKDFLEWQAAWREAVARLNQFRNHLQQRFSLTLLFVGAPWLAETIRTYAPDLWSVRMLVIDIEPDASPLRDLQAAHQRYEPVTQSFSDSAPNVELALKAAAKLRGKIGNEAELVLYLIRAGHGLYDIFHLSEAEEVLKEAIQIQRQLDPKSEQLAEALYYLGVVQTMLTDPKASHHLNEALLLFRQAGNVQREANCTQSLGDIMLARSEHEKAQILFEKALSLYQRMRNVNGEANCIKSLGDIALRQSHHEEARFRYEKALSLFQRMGNVGGEANCIKSLGDIALRQSHHEEAHLQYEEALLFYRRIRNLQGEANCIRSLGDVALRQSRQEEARLRYEEALLLYRRVGTVLGEANCIANLGDIALRQSHHEEARLRYEEALPLFRLIGNVNGEANCIRGLGDIALWQSHYEEARLQYEEALPLFRLIGNMNGEANCIKSLGDVALRQSRHEAAQLRYEEALLLYRRRGAVEGEANCIFQLGDIALRRSEHEEARKNFETALALYERIPEPYSIGWTQVRLARLATDETERASFVKAARLAWTQIDRPDMVAELDEEFDPGSAGGSPATSA